MSSLVTGFPISYLSLLIGVCIGMIVLASVLSFVSFVIVIVCIYMGIIRILPCIEYIVSIFHLHNPEWKKNIQSTFIVEGLENVKGCGEKQYIYMFHPHGAFCASFFFHQMTELTDWKGAKGKPVVVKSYYWIPFAQEILDSFGAIPNEYESMKKVLEEGGSLSVLPGGIQEMRKLEKKRIRMKIKNRTGIFRLAIEKGVPLVPVLTYGENELYEIWEGEWMSWIQDQIQKLGFLLVLPTWKSFQKWISVSRGECEQIRTVVGCPISVEEGDSVDDLREKYIHAMKDLYAKTRPLDYALELEIV